MQHGKSSTNFLAPTFLLLLLCSSSLSLAQEFVLPRQGCPMAHCDPAMSDLVRLPAPTGEVARIWQRNELPGEQAGSEFGLGCTGNGTIVACSYFGSSDNLVVYDYDGVRLWTSAFLFNNTARNSVPLISADGSVIMCDDQQVVRFAPDGSIVWQSALPLGGRPISPVLTADGTVVLATAGGPVYAFDSVDGSLLATHFVRTGINDPGYFETINTPAVKGNRVYVSMHHQVDGVIDADHLAWLVAIDIDRAAPAVINEAWHFVFGGTSSASPMRVGSILYFDGDRPAPGVIAVEPHIFAVLDTPTGPREVWRQRVYSPILASYALDPRPLAGFWHFTRMNPLLIRRSLFTGAVIEAMNVNDLLGEAGGFVVSSVVSIAASNPNPVMLVTATKFAGATGPCYLLGIDLVTKSLLWKVNVANNPFNFAASQFPILMGEQGPRVILTNFGSGARAIGAPLP